MGRSSHTGVDKNMYEVGADIAFVNTNAEVTNLKAKNSDLLLYL